MNYTHLTHHERYQIYILKKAGHNPSTIATLMNRHKSTISRELARNSGQRGYRPKQAQRLAVARMRATANARRIDPATWTFAQAKLTEQWSPEQISGFLEAQGLPCCPPRNPLPAHLCRQARRRCPLSPSALPEAAAQALRPAPPRHDSRTGFN